MTWYWTVERSPVGDLVLVGDGTSLRAVRFGGQGPPAALGTGGRRDRAPLSEAADQLAAYFAGERQGFDLPLAPAGTPFQRRVWQAVAAIPYGATATYGSVAAALGRRRSARAVGAANGRNPLPIVVPCHRVVGADGGLTGYGGGLDAKRVLLDLEQDGRRDRSRPPRVSPAAGQEPGGTTVTR